MVVKTIKPHYDTIKREVGSVYQVTQNRGKKLIELGFVIEDKPTFKNLTKKNARGNRSGRNSTKRSKGSN